MIHGRQKGAKIYRYRLLTARKAAPLTKNTSASCTKEYENKDSEVNSGNNNDCKSRNQLTLKSFSDLTKFRLSQYNTLAAYSTYLHHANGFMPMDSLVFL